MQKQELVRFYFDTLAHDDQIMQWYRALFLASEAIILTAVYAIYSNQSPSLGWIVYLAIGGLVMSVLAVWACVQRGNRVDRQRKKIQEIFWDRRGNKKDPNDELAECFEIFNPTNKAVNRVPRIIFNVVIHILIGAALIAILWVSDAVTRGSLYWLAGGYVVAFLLVYQWLSRKGIPKDLFEKDVNQEGKVDKHSQRSS